MSRNCELQEYTGFSPQEAKLLALSAEGAHIRSIYEKLQVHTKSLCPERAKACSPGLALFASPG